MINGGYLELVQQRKNKLPLIKDYKTLFNAIHTEFPKATGGIQLGAERSVQIPVRTDDGLGILEVSWGIQKGIVNFVEFFPVEVTAQNRAKLIVKIAEINATLAVLGFVIDEESVRFITHAFLDERETIPADVVLMTIRQCVLMFEMFVAKLKKVS